jgi:hypothetical protein
METCLVLKGVAQGSLACSMGQEKAASSVAKDGGSVNIIRQIDKK